MLSFFKKIKSGLSKTNTGVFGKLKSLLSSNKIDEDTLDEIEEILISGDVGVQATNYILDQLKEKSKKVKPDSDEGLFSILRDCIEDTLISVPDEFYETPNNPHVILVVGVNGVGKTTSIGKLTKRFQEEGKSVLLGAADTFRAAAIDQLKIWSDRNSVELVHHKPGSDPSAVAFDTVKAGVARNADVIIIDTAGRLHNKESLMAELDKIHKVIKKVIPEAPHEVMLVLDSSMGQNAIQQAKGFQKITPINSIVLTKLDGSAKGGVIIGINKELGIPVKFVGVGEGIDDLNRFDSKAFIEGIFAEQVKDN